MTRDQFAAFLVNIQKIENEVREDGQKEYAHDENNCFANFDSDSGHGVNRLQSIMSHLNKHFRGIVAFVRGHRSQRENIRGRLKDARLYLALLWAAVEEEERASEKAIHDGVASVGDAVDLQSIFRLWAIEGHPVRTGPTYSDIVLPPNSDDLRQQNECNEAAESAYQDWLAECGSGQ